jgi:hypothetical protein
MTKYLTAVNVTLFAEIEIPDDVKDPADIGDQLNEAACTLSEMKCSLDRGAFDILDFYWDEK